MRPLIIKEMSPDDRPREKMTTHGPRSLSDAELIAILLRTGNTQLSAIGLAQHLISQTGGCFNSMANTSLHDLMKIKGIGAAKATEIMAALEIGRRRMNEIPKSFPFIKSSKDAYHILAPLLLDQPAEEFWMLVCNRSNKVTDKIKISLGGMHATMVDMKILMKYALERSAAGILVAHNHPSGNLMASDADKKLTRKISESCSILDITLLDHIIIAGSSYLSFLDEGML